MARSASTTKLSRLRTIAILLGMTGAAAGMAREALSFYPDWALLALAGLVGAAGIGLTRRSLLVQVLSRATAWVVLLPSAIGVAFAIAAHDVHLLRNVAPLALATAVPLALAWPALRSKEARAAFAPKVCRDLFLAGSTATAATGIAAGAIAMAASVHAPATAASAAAIGTALLASAIGVVRMRAWGVLLGALTSFVLLGIAAFVGNREMAILMALAAAPPLLFHTIPILLARAGGPASVRADGEAAVTHRRLRVATVPAEVGLDEGELVDAEELTNAPPARAMRSAGGG